MAVDGNSENEEDGVGMASRHRSRCAGQRDDDYVDAAMNLARRAAEAAAERKGMELPSSAAGAGRQRAGSGASSATGWATARACSDFAGKQRDAAPLTRDHERAVRLSDSDKSAILAE